MDLPSTDLFLRPRLLAAGFTDAELLRLRRSGAVATVRAGAYVPAGDERLGDPAARHALLIRSTLPRLGSHAVLSHVSAAVWHDLPVWSLPLRRVHVTRQGSGGGRVSGRLHVHVAPLSADDVVEVGGIRVTSVARTVVDLARTTPFEPAVVIADATARVAGRDALLVVQDRLLRWQGGRAARRVLAFADDRSESVGESRSRVAMWRTGLPPPVLQWQVRAVGGRLVGRVDFGWPERRTVGEFDGRVKYGRLLRPGQSAGEAVYEEKLREDDLRAEGLAVVRWTWADLDRFEPIAARLRRAFSAT